MRKYIQLNEVIRTGYGNEYKPLIIYTDSIASISENRYGNVRLLDGYSYTVKEDVLSIQRMINKVENEI